MRPTAAARRATQDYKDIVNNITDPWDVETLRIAKSKRKGRAGGYYYKKALNKIRKAKVEDKNNVHFRMINSNPDTELDDKCFVVSAKTLVRSLRGRGYSVKLVFKSSLDPIDSWLSPIGDQNICITSASLNIEW